MKINKSFRTNEYLQIETKYIHVIIIFPDDSLKLITRNINEKENSYILKTLPVVQLPILLIPCMDSVRMYALVKIKI